MDMQRSLLLTSLALVSVLLLFQWYDLDVVVQNYFYDAAAPAGTSRWLVDAGNKQHALIFHKLLKLPLVLVGITTCIALVVSYVRYRFAHLRQGLWVVLLSVILVPLTINSIKQVSNIYCPSQLDIYGGKYPDVKTFDAYPIGFAPSSRGHCYPAAHASAGFALMSLFFLFTKRKHKIAGLMTGMTLGWVMGLYQMLKGAHFLSHTLVTMCASWLLIGLCYAVVKKISQKTGGYEKNSDYR